MLSSCIVGNVVCCFSNQSKNSNVVLIRRHSDSGQNESMNIYVDIESVTCIQVSYVLLEKKKKV